METKEKFNKKAFQIASIINTVLCLILFVLSWGVLFANILQAASGGGILLMYMSLIYPAIPIISMIAFWVAYIKRNKRLSLLSHIFPWAYTAVLAVILLTSFS